MTIVGGLEIRPEVIARHPEPICSGCGAAVDRPKCLFDSGTYCPRHWVRDQWRAEMLRDEKSERSSDAGDIPMCRRDV
jgi:hypothetical protein